MPRGGNQRGPWPERFWKKVEKSNGCWEWTASKDPHGYGTVRNDKKTLGAHRVSYELIVGKIPDGLDLDHLCRNPGCVNPAHLEPVTHRENVRRGNAGLHCAIKTHCPHRHEYTPENTAIYDDGLRRCRECRRLRAAKYNKIRKEKNAADRNRS